MIWVLLQSESPWQRNDAITLFIYFCVSLYQEFYSGLIALKTAYKKRGELLWAIASKKNFIDLHSAAFVIVFGRNLVHAYKFRIFQKSAR